MGRRWWAAHAALGFALLIACSDSSEGSPQALDDDGGTAGADGAREDAAGAGGTAARVDGGSHDQLDAAVLPAPDSGGPVVESDAAVDPEPDARADAGADAGDSGAASTQQELGTALIGPDGGAVALPSGAYVHVPAGALDDDVQISIEEQRQDLPGLPAGLTARGKAYAFLPHGQTFAAPITIVLPYDGAADDVVPLRLADEDDTSWSAVTGSVAVGGVLAFTSQSFSIYQPASAGMLELCDGATLNLAEFLVPGQELIVDVDVHASNTQTNPLGAAALVSYLAALGSFPWIERSPGCSDAACFDQDELEAQVLANSDTHSIVLGGISYSLGSNGAGTSGFAALSNEDLFAMADGFDTDHAGRTLRTASVMPNDRIAIQLTMMERLADEVVAWRTTTGWSPNASGGYFLDDMIGEQMIEQGLALGVPVFLVEKGMPMGGYSPTYTDPRDVGPTAAAYPAAKLVVLHAAFEHGMAAGQTSRPDGSMDFGWGAGVGEWPEGPYDADDVDVQALYPLTRGVNSLIKSMLDNGIGPNENVYAGLGGVFAQLMDRPTEAAHVLGKLLLYVGEDNILWGTESVWYGNPTPQIEAFRAFEIPAQMRADYGYPELTPERKAKILGVNAARLFCLSP
jgi:predicted TIM-barrel fold metal-dependent hydrolase